MSLLTSSPIDRLKVIINKYESWSDPLSERLKRWGKKAKDSNLEKRVYKLRSEILVNSLDERLRLQVPILDRKWVWEELFLKHYLSYTGTTTSPFDNEIIDAKPHAFALDLLDWSKPFKDVLLDNHTGDSEVLVPCGVVSTKEKIDPAVAYMVYSVYLVLAQGFVQRMKMRDLCRTLTKSAETMSVIASDSRASTEVLKEQNTKSIAAFTYFLEKSPAAISEAQKSEFKIRQSMIDEKQRHLENTQEENNNLQTFKENQKKEITSLRQQLGRTG